MTVAVEGVSGQLHAPAALYLRERSGTHFTGGWVGPRAGLDGRNISSPLGFSIPDRPTRSQSLYRLSNPVRTIYMYKIHVYTTLLLRVAAYCTPSSGRNYVFLTENHLLLESYFLSHLGCVITIKHTILLV